MALDLHWMLCFHIFLDLKLSLVVYSECIYGCCPTMYRALEVVSGPPHPTPEALAMYTSSQAGHAACLCAAECAATTAC